MKIFLKNAVYRRLKPEGDPETGDAAEKPVEESPEDSPEALAQRKQLELF